MSTSILPTLSIICFSAAVAFAEVTECTPRGGAPNFIGSLATSKESTIAYLGGSITAAEGWRPKTLAWFGGQNPDVKINEVNATIGGTGSDLAVFRLNQDVLAKKPNLMFVEFAVNDGGLPTDRIHKAVEGIVRQTWKAIPTCDICFIYTIAGPQMLEDTKSGRTPRSVAAMEDVAGFYNIPSINFGVEIAKREKEGALIYQGRKPTNDVQIAELKDKVVFSPDGVHPYADTGHEIYLQTFIQAWSQVTAASTQVKPHALAAPRLPDNWENAQLIPLTEKMLSGQWTHLDPTTNELGERFSDRLNPLWMASSADSAIQFKFKGTSAAVYDLLGPDCGQVIAAISGKSPQIFPRFDSFSTYHRLGITWLGDFTNGTHNITVQLDSKSPNKSSILNQRGLKAEPPEKFKENNYYAGALLILGVLEP